MNKFQATTLGVLRIGDRFYFLGSASKAVWELREKTDGVDIVTVVKVGVGYLKRAKDVTPVVFLSSRMERQS
ncbi:hypothetical protein [Zoogloea sp.]|uniref:hypothetical protein n=1 Tax=Zoogloea sp. TaxID=49181 RepID=UPI001415FE7B|nr:MAG: hypothetical protein F9K15_12865 [Zoogloea sp.]